jgi:putative endonuclease
MKVSYVYILKCIDKSFYTCITSNLEQRIFRHQSAYFRDCYTASRLSIELVFYCEFTAKKKPLNRAKDEASRQK